MASGHEEAEDIILALPVEAERTTSILQVKNNSSKKKKAKKKRGKKKSCRVQRFEQKNFKKIEKRAILAKNKNGDKEQYLRNCQEKEEDDGKTHISAML